MILEKIKGEVGKAIVGMDEIVELMTIALIANGHVLLEGVPGIAKTTLSKNFANTLGLKFSRIQMTPDLLPADILGHTFYDMRSGQFKLRKGPIFANVVLVDEINRASPKTQSALLEAMEERQVTIDGLPLKLPEPFIVLATRNPVEMEGVYELPTAQMDRFMMKVDMTYLPEESEKAMLRRKSLGQFTEAQQVVLGSEIAGAKREALAVRVSDAIIDYIYEIVKETRLDERVILGASPRAGEHLLYASKVKAYLEGRSYVIPDDVKWLAVPVIAHRIVVKPEYEVEGVDGKGIVRDVLERVEVPTE
ncbi:putative AAA-type ATPase chaperone 1 [Thermococcus cleftensis]|uniref:AAA-type ATPase chaperone 1 n=1 Tax=Thermococcus cleftensis (strain DSM 27260 / KACC 17922 / CL1) TaxID=163003 RepID=I3ZTL7_THECF|nr:MoxR family ATPase [Thermococcus cleftensis]AFL95051.1 putative AAA-type ATPase chaperone 1 [Thermococcus cleftensis]